MSAWPFWLAASALMLSGLAYLGNRLYRTFVSRIQRERQQSERLAALHLATMEALASAIDAKDRTAPSHVRRVRTYAHGLARALGLAESEIDAIATAATLHDIGKLAVPEHILAKPGALTPEERQKVRIHSQVGADIVASVPFPSPVAPLIRCHHERWDGGGYPAGLAGEAIPLGARILSIADFFDSLTSERPYHPAIPADAAASLVEEESGRAFDPALTATFLRILPRLLEEASAEGDALARAATTSSGAADVKRPDGGPDAPRPSVFDDIALAHREIYALYQIAQTMGTSLGVSDTMTLIAARLSSVVPFSTCALFLYAESSDTLHCRFASGTDSELIQQLALKNGEGLTGWVARNRRPLVNARPAADLEAAGSGFATALQSALVCPLLFEGRLIGTLAVYHTTPSFYRDDHRRLLDRVCEQAAAVINNAIVFEQTQEASLTDPLTGLPNTRFMFMHLARELARAARHKAEVSMLVLDLDNFKEINDTYGHHVGDRALRELARVLRTAIRPYDICVRYAGDEFVVVLAGCGREEAEHKRAELQETIDRAVFEPSPGLRLSISTSAGAAVFPHDGDNYDALLAAADRRMYQDKHARKKRMSGHIRAVTRRRPGGDAHTRPE